MEALGPDSYIATAMAGMIEDAKENIENDFALSWKDRAENYEKKLDILTEEYKKAVKQVRNNYYRLRQTSGNV